MALVLEESSMPVILCCLCGVEIQQNAANMCVTCLRNSVDITEGINRQLTIHSCRSCGRFLAPPWQSMQLESKELMAVCLRKIAGLSSVKLIDAVWIWTEPHSMRLKIKLTVQKEVMNGAILQQACLVEFAVRNQQCRTCEANYAQGSWHAVVQVRQRVTHKRTFLFLEQMILKHHAHTDCIKIVTFKDGIDFYFTDKNLAMKFIDFLQANTPTKSKYARKLVTADHKSNVGDFKHNFIIEIAPVCKDDLVILPADLARNLSNISRMVLVKRVGAGIHVIDPLTGERNEINTEKYWRSEFTAVMNSKQLIKYTVLSVEPIIKELRTSAKSRSKGADRKIKLAEVVVVRERDFGVNDTQFTCITHLGNLLKEGDTVLGYDFTNTNWNMAEDISEVKLATDLPDLILVRKYYGDKGERQWELKNLEVDERHEGHGKEQQDADDEDMEEFMQEIEADKEMRANIKLFKKSAAAANKVHTKLPAKVSTKKADKAASKGGKKGGKGSSMEADDEDDNFEDMDDGEEGDWEDMDDEEIRLDELLDELTVKTSEEAEVKAASSKILSASDAARVPAMKVDSTGFDASNFDASKFKFT